MKNPDRARFDLNMILPYVDFLRRKVDAPPAGNSLCYKGEPDGHFQLPPSIEEGGLVEPFDLPGEYQQGQSTELEQFPQAGVIYRPDYLPPIPNYIPDHVRLLNIRRLLQIIIKGGKSG